MIILPTLIRIQSRISNEPEVKKEDLEKKEGDANAALPDLETIKENN